MSDPVGRTHDELWVAPLSVVDPELAELVAREGRRQADTLSMVASENFAPNAVLELQGSILTNKYADGYPGNRAYDGCEVVDEIETLAISRAKELFGAQYANVQAYSGADANRAVLRALCDPGDVVLGFDFEHGGHPTHYDKETFAGHYYRGFAYHVRESDRLVDMDEVAELAHRHHPKVIFAGWSCYQRYLDFAAFREIADEVGARLVVDMAHFSGLVAAGLHPDPIPYADVATMTIHKTLGGGRGGAIVGRAEFGAAIDEAIWPGEQGCPLIHVMAGKAATFALCRTTAFADRLAQTVSGARIVADVLHEAEARTHMQVVTGGTDVHQLLLNTAGAGRDAFEVMETLHAIGVHSNAMRIAFDKMPRPSASGLRLGTTSLATRGFDDDAFREIGAILADTLSGGLDTGKDELVVRTAALARSFPPFLAQ